MDLALKSPRPAEPVPVKAEPPYDATLDQAPFETLKEYYPCPPAGLSRTLMTQDIEGAQSFAGIKDPLDPMVSFFPCFFFISIFQCQHCSRKGHHVVLFYASSAILVIKASKCSITIIM